MLSSTLSSTPFPGSQGKPLALFSATSNSFPPPSMPAFQSSDRRAAAVYSFWMVLRMLANGIERVTLLTFPTLNVHYSFVLSTSAPLLDNLHIDDFLIPHKYVLCLSLPPKDFIPAVLQLTVANMKNLSRTHGISFSSDRKAAVKQNGL
jgi:hypothetical protein